MPLNGILAMAARPTCFSLTLVILKQLALCDYIVKPYCSDGGSLYLERFSTGLGRLEKV